MRWVIRKRGKPLDVLVAAWFERHSGFLQAGTHVLWLWGERGYPLTWRVRNWFRRGER